MELIGFFAMFGFGFFLTGVGAVAMVICRAFGSTSETWLHFAIAMIGILIMWLAIQFTPFTVSLK